MLVKVVILIVFVVGVRADDPATCPKGGQIYERGISDAGKVEVINAHNALRLQIAQGVVPGQPQGTNLVMQIYDDQLGLEARNVSNSCSSNHSEPIDSRWKWVGQNTFIVRSSLDQPNKQNWTMASLSWFNEYKHYNYPKGSADGVDIGHYTQLVWYNSQYVGCDFIYYYDNSVPGYPYCKLYTCNYGPGGNIVGVAPYSTDGNGCPNLC